MSERDLIIKLNKIATPYYLYDVALLKQTLEAAKKESEQYGYLVHYALKANSNTRVLEIINEYGFGADCVSGNEVVKAISTGFQRDRIVYAGVGKTDHEISIALNNDIACFNCESPQEIEVINEIASSKNKIAPIALRINPNVDAKTHYHITTGLEENKFGINTWDIEDVLLKIASLANVQLIGIHFHIGSQVTDLTVFKELCIRINEIQRMFDRLNIRLEYINCGGGLGIDYRNPEKHPIPDFQTFFRIFKDFLELRNYQQLHFELGRSLVGQMGSLISRVLYIKDGVNTKFAILDAGMTDLIRPAMYQAFHKIENLVSGDHLEKYDVVGPICESSDTFVKGIMLPLTKRGDLVAIRSAGAYGEVMASQYNLRNLARSYFTDEI